MVGLFVVASLIVGALFLAIIDNGQVGRSVSSAVCRILGGGAGTCGTPPAAKDTHLPTEPCSTDSVGYTVDASGAAFNFAAGGSKSATTERLSNGQYRVTVTSGSSGGVETGVGWDARVNINGTKWGDDMGATIAAQLGASRADVYVVDTRGQADDIVAWAKYSQATDTAVNATGALGPVGWVQKHLTRPVTDFAAQKLGMKKPAKPTSTLYLGGASANASAQITPFVGGLEGRGGIEVMLGAQRNADGTVTVIGQGTASLVGSGAISVEQGSLGGDANVAVKATYKGTTLTSVTVEAGTMSQDHQRVRSWTLPIGSSADRDAANALLYDVNPTSWGSFFEASKDHGQMTQVDYKLSGLNLSGSAGVKAVEEGRVSLGFALPKSEVTDAQYFNGDSWAPWSACSS